MKTKDFSFNLPGELIAQYPPAERGKSRLMVLDRSTGSRTHRMVEELPDILDEASLLVFNNSKVRKARLYARSLAAGINTEFLLLNREQDDGRCVWKVMAKRARRRRMGSRYAFADGREGEIVGEDGEFRLLRFDQPIDENWLDVYGHIPLPPYIKRDDGEMDSERYQTVYARVPGSAAAPTAGLHFTDALLEKLRRKGMETAFITLHVGLGTFLPVRSENIEDHKMHEEVFTIDEQSAARIEDAKARGRPIVAVGTTSVRTLESAWDGKKLRRGEGSTDIFIYPGYSFNLVDALFTNFHTPESTLLMLVSAFASGREWILESYELAVRERYRFFSYGDAMFIR
ncbi:MAG: tRNA preQ1(34) S-adenosylmethionine ribosyltransferase-isomerase QueA [Spirochaetaceae bacterium]|jgi:S-adenosylmethionine:tRNA ribosyltransferase-isomerase|nr:tRNA preQ1(34) S-adenosylmethionine ribosyltransferase-isomerase QueA [Spirochaetaceae bacterium]